VPQESLYLSSGGHGGRGSNLGARPPKVNFFNFLYGASPGSGGETCRMEIIVTGDPFDV